jgi:hypothetical protein
VEVGDGEQTYDGDALLRDPGRRVHAQAAECADLLMNPLANQRPTSARPRFDSLE